MSKQTKSIYYIAIAILAVAALLSVFFFTRDIDHVREHLQHFLEYARASNWSFPLVLGLYVLCATVMFPVILLNLATAIVFGPIYGFIYALCGTLLAAGIFFLIGRFGRNRGLKTLLSSGKLATLDRKLNEAGVLGVAVLRLVPVAPFGIFNMAAGITSIGFLDYMAGTFISFWPGGIARAVVGDSLVSLILHPSLKTSLYLAAGLVLWIAIVVALHFGLKKYRNRLA